MRVKPETLEADFKISAIGTLVAGQWFGRNANTSRVDQGEYPLLLVTGGVLHQVCFQPGKGGEDLLTPVATTPVICFAVDGQVCISKYCKEFFACSAETIQRASRATSGRATYYSKRGRRLSDKVGSGSHRGRNLHALPQGQNECP